MVTRRIYARCNEFAPAALDRAARPWVACTIWRFPQSRFFGWTTRRSCSSRIVSCWATRATRWRWPPTPTTRSSCCVVAPTTCCCWMSRCPERVDSMRTGSCASSPPRMPVVMVTKSEEDATMKEAIGANVRDYLVKPVTPRQVLAVVTRILDGPLIRSQALARAIRRALSRHRVGALSGTRLARLDRALGGTRCSGTWTSPPRARWGCTSRCVDSIPTCIASSRRS